MGDEQSVAYIQENLGVDFVAKNVEDFFGKVDVMMVTSRAGSLHKDYIMPFVKQGMPVFIDKPFTASVKDAEELAVALKESGSLVMAGSGCKYVAKVKKLKERVKEWRESGQLIQASMNFNVMLTSPYDGVYFYAPHLVEMCIEIFGDNIVRLRAEQQGANMIVNVFYPNDAVTLHFTATAPQSTCVLYGTKENIVEDMDISDRVVTESEAFRKMLESKKMPYTVEECVFPIRLIDWIEQSAKENKEIVL